MGDSYTMCNRNKYVGTLILTGNRIRHDEQFFYVPHFRNRQFFKTFSPP
jgi:hypothetical protein